MGSQRRWLVRLVGVFFLLASLAMTMAWFTIGPDGLRGRALYFHTLVAVPFVLGWVAFSWLPSLAEPFSPWLRRVHGWAGAAGLMTTVLAALAMSSWFGTEPIRTLNASHAWSGVITLVGLIVFVAIGGARRRARRE